MQHYVRIDADELFSVKRLELGNRMRRRVCAQRETRDHLIGAAVVTVADVGEGSEDVPLLLGLRPELYLGVARWTCNMQLRRGIRPVLWVVGTTYD